jgi:periplasmic copper chaperone A
VYSAGSRMRSRTALFRGGRATSAVVFPSPLRGGGRGGGRAIARAWRRWRAEPNHPHPDRLRCASAVDPPRKGEGKRSAWRVLAAAILLAAAACGAHAHSYKQKSLEIVHPWCLETDAADKTAAIYMVVRALTKRGDRLTAASTSIGTAELREPTAAEGSKPVASLEVKRDKELTLKRGGPHILVTGLTRPLGAYDSFLLTLTFARAGRIEVEVMVEEKSTAEPKGH